MLSLHLKRALQDIRQNRLLNAVTISTIALSILIVSAAFLFFLNTTDMLEAWRRGIRIMVYLESDLDKAQRHAIETRIRKLYGVQAARFIPKETALEQLRAQMQRQSAILDGLDQNPLPDAFEVQMIPTASTWEKAEELARSLEAVAGVSDVEYGQRWVERFVTLFNLFRLTSYAMGGLFFIASVFIVGNTVRLILYSRRQEVEIMRLVGATERFILAPFYFQSMIQGALGGVCGLVALFIMFMLIQSKIQSVSVTGLVNLRFLSPGLLLTVVTASTLVGWLGCHLSLKQYLKV
ncbi:MAG: permease-like cell division protein FtsX [Desulfobacterales bacterium]|nr:permease-like cell division protein FtsX [Desulfobacterales bacterium]MDJ0883746.1 permease-like cell division protein FtsX [Desulfobacterales bacterium]